MARGSQGMKGMTSREKTNKKMKATASGKNPGYHSRSASTVGGGGVGNTEYRHDGPHNPRNPQTRGTKKMGYATGHGSRNKQTPSNYYVQDGQQKMQKCMAYRMRSNKSRGSMSNRAFKGGGGNPYGGAY